MTWPCTDPAYRKDGDEMTDAKTWTCNKCQNVNPSGKCISLKCSSGRITGLSLEDLVAPLEAENKNLREWSLMLETDVKKLRATIQDLERQRDGHQQAAWAAVERCEKLRESVRELGARAIRLGSGEALFQKRIAELEKERDRYRDGFHKASAVAEQLSQAQKRNSSLQSDLTYAAELLGTADPAAKAANLETAVDLLRRLARDESLIVREGAERGLEGIKAQKPAECQPVDRERAIGTVMELMAQVRGTGFPSDVDAARETLDAILGTAKAEPAAKLVTPEFVAFVECIAAGGEGRDVVAWAEHLLKMMRAEPSAFTPAPTEAAPSKEVVEELAKAGAKAYRKARGQEHVRWEDFSEKTRIGERAVARSTYALIAADHSRLAKENAAHVKRVRELEGELGLANRERGEIRQQLDDTRAEVERLKAAASQPGRCPADGMSDLDAGLRIYVHGDLEATGKKARELFTLVTPANDERKPKVGDEVWYQGKMRKVLKLGQHEFRVAMGNKNDAYLEDDNVGTWLRHDSCGFTWWRSDPSAKGAE